jgi:hypothetical protein
MLSTLIIVPTDVAEYAHYAYQALAHPGLEWPREYPPPALAVFLLPLVLPLAYGWAFPLLAGGALAALAGVGFRRLGDAWVKRTLLYLLLGAASLVTGRYDIFPAGLLAVGVMAAEQGRWNRAWAATTLGAALKVFPVVAWPILLVAEWRSRGRIAWSRPALASAALAGLWALPRAWGVSDWGWLGFLSRRPPNVGSLAGQLTALLDPRFSMYASYGSVDVVGRPMDLVSAVLAALGVAGVAGIYLLYGRGRLETPQAVILVLSAVILGSKVFSVQYLIWLIPLWAWYPVSRLRVLAALLNTVSYPLMFSLYVGNRWTLGPWLLASLAARNLALLAGAIRETRDVRREGQFVI